MSDTEFSQADYKDRCVSFANSALLDLAATNGKQYESISFVQNNIENLTECAKDEIYAHTKDDIIFESDNSAVSYYFECDGTATVYIDNYVNDVWTNISSFNINSDNVFKEYRGFITGIDPAAQSIRLRFSGVYMYNVKNVAMYSVKRSDLLSDIPQYGRMCKYNIAAMTNGADGSKFIAFSDTNILKHNGHYVSESDYVIIDEHTIAVPHDAIGEFTVYYISYPSQISDNISASEVIDIDPEYAALIPLFIASNIYADDNIALASTCYNKYVSLKSQLYNVPHNTTEWKRFYNYGR